MLERFGIDLDECPCCKSKTLKEINSIWLAAKTIINGKLVTMRNIMP
jgi:hypothetical protein